MKAQGNDIIVRAEDLYKRFCKDMKRSMWYGIQDLIRPQSFSDEKELKLRKGEFWAVRDVNLEIRRGQSIGLIGRNGSGKTTLMRLISGIIPSTFGTLETHGRITPIFRLRSGMHPHYSGRDYIYIQGAMHGMKKEEIDRKVEDIIRFAELEDFIDAPIGTYSSGMKARLGYSIAIASDFELLIIDEALAVGDTEFRAKCIDNLKSISREKAIVFVSHNMDMVREVSNTIVVMEKGEKIMETGDVEAGIEYYYRHIARPKDTDKKAKPRLILGASAPLPGKAVNLPSAPLANHLDVISLHIPKTAGTSFRKILETQYGRQLGRLDIRNGRLMVDEKLFWGQALPSEVRAIHGHFYYNSLIKSLDIDPEKSKIITWLRHPVERVLSNYHYLASRMAEEMREEEKGLNLLMKMQKSLEEYAQSDFARNRMSKFLEGAPIEDFFFIGLTEQFEKDLALLARKLGWKVDTVPHVNQGPSWKDQVDPELLKKIEEWNRADMELYERVRKMRSGKQS